MRKDFNTEARVLITFWDNVVQLIYNSIFVKEKKEQQKPFDWPLIFSSRQINEAIDNSYGLVGETLAAYVNYQVALNLVTEQFSSIEMDEKTVQQLVETKVVDIQELEDVYRKILPQKSTLSEIENQLEQWRSALDVLIEKWRAEWKKREQSVIERLLDVMQRQHGVQFISIESEQLVNPTKDREDILIDLEKFYHGNLPKGWSAKSSMLHLRALWAVGTYSAYHKVDADANKSLLRSINNSLKEESKEINMLTQKQTTEFERVKNNLQSLVSIIPTERALPAEKHEEYQIIQSHLQKLPTASSQAPKPK